MFRTSHTISRSLSLLRGLDPLLTPSVLHALRSAGHGDEIVVVDCNFPAVSTAKHTNRGEAIVVAGADSTQLGKAILSVFPVDAFDPSPVSFMGVVGEPDKLVVAHTEFKAELDAVSRQDDGTAWPFVSVERFDFYDRAAAAYCIIQAGGERRPFANFIIKKGVIGPDGTDLTPAKAAALE